MVFVRYKIYHFIVTKNTKHLYTPHSYGEGMPFEKLLLGTAHPTYGTYTIQPVGDNVVVGISAGREKGARKKNTPNEDAVGVYRLSDNSQLYLVADAHFGAHASEIALREFPEILERNRSQCQDIRTALYLSIVDIDAKIRELKPETRDVFDDGYTEKGPRKIASATTCIAALKRGNEITYVSVGDSYVYQMRHAFRKGHRVVFMNEAQHSPRVKELGHGFYLGETSPELRERLFEYLHRVAKKERFDELREQATADPAYRTIYDSALASAETNWRESREYRDYVRSPAGNAGVNEPFFRCRYTEDRARSTAYPKAIELAKERFRAENEWLFTDHNIEYASLEGVLQIGQFTSSRDATVVLATDGIETETSGVPIEAFHTLVTQSDLLEGVTTYFEQTLRDTDAQRADNIGLIAIRT